MREAIISTHAVRVSAEQSSVEVLATLDAGVLAPGMCLHIPLNGMLVLTVRIGLIEAAPAGRVLIHLDCDQEPAGAELVAAFNFAQETLWVRDDGTD